MTNHSALMTFFFLFVGIDVWKIWTNRVNRYFQTDAKISTLMPVNTFYCHGFVQYILSCTLVMLKRPRKMQYLSIHAALRYFSLICRFARCPMRLMSTAWLHAMSWWIKNALLWARKFASILCLWTSKNGFCKKEVENAFRLRAWKIAATPLVRIIFCTASQDQSKRGWLM